MYLNSGYRNGVTISKLKEVLNKFPDQYIIAVTATRELVVLDLDEKIKGFFLLGMEEWDPF